jgi:hypothetical protein
MKWLLAALAAGGFYFLYTRGTFCEGGLRSSPVWGKGFLCPAAPTLPGGGYVEAVLPQPVNYVAVPPSPYTLTAPVSLKAAAPSDMQGHSAITNPPANFSIAVFSSGGGAGQM